MSTPVEEHPAIVDRLEQVDAAQQRRSCPEPEAPISADHVAHGDVEVDAVEHDRRRRTTCVPFSTASVRDVIGVIASLIDRRRSGSAALTGEQPVGEAGHRNREREEDQ
jgi:hypothetical protein